MTKPSPDPAPRIRRISAEARAQELIEAGLRCLAQGGITAFTIDNICAEAKASRGLIAHHFGSKDGLLAAVYAEVYRRILADLAPAGQPADLIGLIDHAFDDAGGPTLRIWLALWGEVAGNPALLATHRSHYALYRSQLAQAIAQSHPSVDAQAIAVALIALIDGLWLELSLAPADFTTEMARAQAHRVLRALLA